MPKPRYTQVSLEATPYYHCISRCVRQSWLCGKKYEHRRQWLEDRLHEASSAFAIDVCAYSIMSNHYHVVLHINIAQAQAWNMDEVIKRWHQLYGGFALSQRYLSGATLGKAELATLNDEAEIWRERLINVSWLMRTVNERIARQANSEDQCTGRFWEGRGGKPQVLLDEAALAACMAMNIDMGRFKSSPCRDGKNTGKFRSHQY